MFKQATIGGFRGLQNFMKYQYAARIPTPSNSTHYDIVIVGGNIGGILSKHIDHISQGRYSVYVVFDQVLNQNTHLNIAFQQGYVNKDKYLIKTKEILSKYTAHSDGISVSQYLPEENAIVLENGRRIGYKQLVISQNLEDDFDQVTGLKTALLDQGNPIFSTYVNTSVEKVEKQKMAQFFQNFFGGNAYFYIPPRPFRGAISDYNFLAAFDEWNQSLNRTTDSIPFKVNIINANNKFIDFNEETDNFLKNELKKRNIEVLYNTRLLEVKKDSRQIIIENAEKKQKQTLDYDNVFSLVPQRPSNLLKQAGLINQQSNWLLDVDQQTLRHKKYNNIFGLGEICNLPTTPSYFANQQQSNVVRNNIFRSIQGLYLNAQYDGYTKLPLYIGKNQLTFVSHLYDNKHNKINLMNRDGGKVSRLSFYTWSYVMPWLSSLFYNFTIWGEPYYILMKNFDELKKVPENQRNIQQQTKYVISKRQIPE